MLAPLEIMQLLAEESTRLRIWGSVVSNIIRLRAEFQHLVSLVDIVAKLRAEGCGFRIPAGVKGLSLQKVRVRSGAHLATYSKVTGVFLGIKLPEREVDYSSPSSVNLQNEWSYVSAPLRAFVECLEASSLFYLPLPLVIAVSQNNCMNN
jgi:hypothetical protein